jgi:microcompartment protein CcmL/EutN
VKNPVRGDLGEMARLKAQYAAARLAVLERMGLAESVGPNTWKVRGDCETVLRAMQQAGDRQKTLAQHVHLHLIANSHGGVPWLL